MVGSARPVVARHWRYPTFLAIVAGCALALIGSARIAANRSRGSSSEATTRGLVLEPRVVRLTDRVFKEGDIVNVRFSITNPLKRPVTITAIPTSCSCISTVPEGFSALPFDLVPGQKVHFFIKGGVRPGPELEQSYSLQVEGV